MAPISLALKRSPFNSLAIYLALSYERQAGHELTDTAGRLMETPINRAGIPVRRLTVLMTGGVWGAGTHRVEMGPWMAVL